MLQLIILTFLLMIIGEPIRTFFIGRLKLFSNLDILQKAILDVYVGGFFLYLVAILPFHIFTSTTVFSLIGLALILTTIIHYESIKQINRKTIRAIFQNRRIEMLDYLFICSVFAIFLFLQLFSLRELVLGSVHDTSLHSLMVQVLLENGHIPLTLQPYLAEAIIYPQASHVIFAFASFVMNYEIPRVVFYVTPLFTSLSVFGAYFLGKKLWPYRPFYLSLSFIFAFISGWPLYITWGAHPFITGFPLFLVSLGMLFSAIHSSEKRSLTELVALGLFFGYVGVIIISYLQALIAITALVFVYRFVKKRYNAFHIISFILIFLISLLPLSPFLFRFAMFYQYPGHNIGISSDFVEYPKQQFFISQSLQWAFENLSPHIVLRLLTILLLIGFAMLLWKTRDYKDIKTVLLFASTIFIASVLLSFLSFFLPSDFNVISWGHQGIILMIPVSILIAIFYVKIVHFGRHHELKLLSRIFSKEIYSNIVLTVMFLSLITFPFLYYRAVEDPKDLKGAYQMFAVSTEGDYDLLLWMKANLTSNAIILVNPHQAGLFIPSISHQKIIYPYTGSWFTRSYQTLVTLLQKFVINETTYNLMAHYNITHIFIGSKTTSWWVGNFEWKPLLLLGNPNFKLVKNFDDAYLFQLVSQNPDTVFSDDFEHALWNENGWQTSYDGNGLGNVTLASDFVGYPEKCLKITTQAIYTISEWKYVRYISREIFAQNDSDITLSFYLNATEGFNGQDAFAVFVSNLYNNQSLIITTPTGVYINYANKVLLDGSEGRFNVSLSTEWHQLLNSSIPSRFVLQFVNLDCDGIENVAYADDITIISKPIP